MFVPFTRLGVVVLLVFLIVPWAAAGSRVDQFRECGSFPDRSCGRLVLISFLDLDSLDLVFLHLDVDKVLLPLSSKSISGF